MSQFLFFESYSNHKCGHNFYGVSFPIKSEDIGDFLIKITKCLQVLSATYITITWKQGFFFFLEPNRTIDAVFSMKIKQSFWLLKFIRPWHWINILFKWIIFFWNWSSFQNVSLLNGSIYTLNENFNWTF